MNDTAENKKDSILKSLAIAGFIGLIILIAWVSVKFVSLVPGAFTSLASLAESLTEKQESALEDKSTVPIVVTSDVTQINAGESVELLWDTTPVTGSYTFTYSCLSGVAIDINEEDGQRSIACDTNYNIGIIDSLSLTVDSEKSRFADVEYTIAFLATDDTRPRALGFGSLTVVNKEIQDLFAGEDQEAEATTEVATDEHEATAAEASTPAEPVYEQEFVYTIPVSDPSGRTDLATKFINSGTIVGNSFFVGQIKQAEKGAIQFEVKNYGSKTSEEWTYTVTLPSGGDHTSDQQEPLKPNERAILTVGFPTTTEDSHTFTVSIEESSDRNSTNDKFVRKITFLE